MENETQNEIFKDVPLPEPPRKDYMLPASILISTIFPDCNHGMAMLGLLELLAAQNTSEPTIYKVALQMNKFWFPNQYATIAQYLQNKNQNIESADPKEILGEKLFQRIWIPAILQAVGPQAPKGGVNCGVSGESAVPTQSSGGGCGI